MGIDKFVTNEYSIHCKGRDSSGNEPLEEAVPVQVTMTQRGNNFYLDTNCPHSGGGHGDYCRVIQGSKVTCPYSVDLPYALEIKKW